MMSNQFCYRTPKKRKTYWKFRQQAVVALGFHFGSDHNHNIIYIFLTSTAIYWYSNAFFSFHFSLIFSWILEEKIIKTYLYHKNLTYISSFFLNLETWFSCPSLKPLLSSGLNFSYKISKFHSLHFSLLNLIKQIYFLY